jgi:hypothetical protein
MYIRVGCRRVRVKTCDGAIIEERTKALGAMGCSEYERNEILLKDGLPESVRAVTLLHELLHDLSSSYSLRLNEQTVDTLATSLVTALRDNPNLVTTLVGRTRK